MFAKLSLIALTALIPSILADPFKVTSGKHPIVSSSGLSNPVLSSTFSSQSVSTNWFPTKDNLIFNASVPFGTPADLGWVFPPFDDPEIIFDGYSRNISVSLTYPNGTDEFIFWLAAGPETDFCGFFHFYLEAVLFDLPVGRYVAHWKVDVGKSSHPHAPVDPESGCGPLPFDIKTYHFNRKFKVVEA